MSEVKETKSCANCKFYRQYYIKSKNGFKTIYDGICLHKNNKNRTPGFICENWEDSAVKEQEREISIIKALWDISKKLNDIADVLNDDLGRIGS